MKHEILAWLDDRKRDELIIVSFDTDDVFEIHSPVQFWEETKSPYICVYSHPTISSSHRIYVNDEDYRTIVEAKNLTLEKGKKLVELRQQLLKENKNHTVTDIEIQCTVLDERIVIFQTKETLFGDYYSHSIDMYVWNDREKDFTSVYDINNYEMVWMGTDFIDTTFRRTRR